MRALTAATAALLLSVLVTAQAAEVTSRDERSKGPVERVATLDFITTEIAILLGRDPVAVGGIGYYLDWVGIGKETVKKARDLGRRAEPDLETLAAAEPDLILGATFRHQALADGLGRIAPVVLYDWLPDDPEVGPLEHTRAVVRHMGKRLDRTERAEELLDDMDDSLAEQRTRLEEAGLSGAPVVLAQHVSGTNRFNLYTEESLGVAIAEAIGLDNAWQGEAEKFGYKGHGLEALLKIEGAHLILIAQPEDNAYQQVKESAIWQSLPAVKADRVHRLPPKTWFFGGPRTIARLARQFTDALVAN